MEIKLITGATAFEAGVNTIKQIDVADLETQNLVVVPDAFSMQAENLIFDTLKIKSTFNIEVVGISRLASKILRGANVPFKRISALEEVFCIYKACKTCEGEFTYFKNCNVDLCMKILQIIKQFKACKILPEKIKPVGDELLDSKMHDLKMIYVEYEKLLGEKLDLSRLLDFFLEKCENDLDLSKINLFFVNFDSFTMEINDFICRLASRVNRVCIGMAKPLSPKNAYIYEDDIFRKTTALAKQYGISVQVENFPTALENERLDIVKNLFAFDVESKPNANYFMNLLGKNARDEVDFVAKYIKNEITQGRAFKDFAVAVSDEKYFSLVKDTFACYGISANIDDAVDLSQTVLGRFVLKMTEIAKLGFNRQAFEYLASSPLLGADENVLHDIFYYVVEDEEEFVQRFPQYGNLISLIKMISCGKKIGDFAGVLNDLIELVSEQFQQFLSCMEDEKLFKKQSENLQSLDLIKKVLEKLSELGGQEDVSLFDFENVLSLALKSVKVETIPSYIDAVFVGDATDSYFEDVKVLFVLGATAGALPKTKSDTALVDDDDIKKLRFNFALEPEIRVLNRRSRLKLFELLQHGKEKLIVSVPMSVDGKQSEKAGFVTDLQALFGRNSVYTTAFEIFDLGLFSKEENLQRLLFFLGCKQNMLSAYSNLKQKGRMPKEFESSLASVLESKIPQEKVVTEVDENLLFPRKTVSASKLETYFACPFKHFLQYGLALKTKENVLPNRKIFGTFMHALLKMFVQEFEDEIGKVSEKQLEEFLSKNVMQLAASNYDKKILQNKTFLTYLKKESKIILKNIIKEQKNSDFRPIMLEKEIIMPFEGELRLVGFIDRVDKWGDYFRIIDYKTGKRFMVQTELFYGKKLQIFLYANAVAQLTNLCPAGVYYFDCQTKYEKHGKTSPLFNGLTLKDNEVVERMDWRLCDGQKSDILGMNARTSPNDGEFRYKDGKPVESLQPEIEYATNVAKQAVKEMKEGYACAKPFAGECTYCPFLTICRHTELDGMRRAYKKKGKKDED